MKKTKLFNIFTTLSGNHDVLMYGARPTEKTRTLVELARKLVAAKTRVLYLAESQTLLRLSGIRSVKNVAIGTIGNGVSVRGFADGVILIDSGKDYVDMSVMDQIEPARPMNTRVVYCLNRTSPVSLPIAGCDTFRLVIDLNKEMRETAMEKTLDIDCIKTAKANISDIKVYGDGDTFGLLCKASSQEQGWMKSTKVMNLPEGALVQVSTQQRNPDGTYAVAEALQYVPGVNMDRNSEPRRMVPIQKPFTVHEIAAPFIPNPDAVAKINL